MNEPYLSIVIPAYNESERLPNTLSQIQEYLKQQKYTFEIIVVDDGSKDDTAKVAESVLSQVNHQVILNSGNKGKGFSVRKGMEKAEGKYLLFTDADLSTPIQEIERTFPFLDDSYDIVIGSRAKEDGSRERKMLWYREVMGRIYNAFGQLLLFPGISDSQCGFKCFKKNVAKDLFKNQKMEGFSFDGEILFLAKQKGYSIKELPVNWYNASQSKVNILSDSLKMFWDLIYIRFLHLGKRK